jgi:hydrogenase maturation protease
MTCSTAGRATRVLVAGIGNVFFGDDGFGVAVAGRLDGAALPSTVDVADYGIRGVHLAYDLLSGRYHTLIMIDAAPVDGPPGTLAVLEIPQAGDDVQACLPEPLGQPALDGHGMTPLAVLSLLRALGGVVERALVVACRPAVIEERMGLSDSVAAAVSEAVRLVTELSHMEAAHA